VRRGAKCQKRGNVRDKPARGGYMRGRASMYAVLHASYPRRTARRGVLSCAVCVVSGGEAGHLELDRLARISNHRQGGGKTEAVGFLLCQRDLRQKLKGEKEMAEYTNPDGWLLPNGARSDSMHRIRMWKARWDTTWVRSGTHTRRCGGTGQTQLG